MTTAALSLFSLLMVAGVSAWVVFLRRGEPILPVEPPRAAPFDVADVFVAALLWFSFQAAAQVLVYRWSGAIDFSRELDLASMPALGRVRLILMMSLSQLAAMICSVIWTKMRRLASWRELGLGVGDLIDDLKLGGAAFLLIGPPVYLIHFLVSQWQETKHPLILALLKDPEPTFLLAAGFAAVIVAPIVEEWLFRVLLQGWLERMSVEESIGADGLPLDDKAPPIRPPLWPIGVSALLFALVHAGHGPDPLPLFFFGVGLGLVYYRTHRIAPVLFIHLLLNLFTLVMLILYLYSGEKP